MRNEVEHKAKHSPRYAPPKPAAPHTILDRCRGRARARVVGGEGHAFKLIAARFIRRRRLDRLSRIPEGEEVDEGHRRDEQRTQKCKLV